MQIRQLWECTNELTLNNLRTIFSVIVYFKHCTIGQLSLSICSELCCHKLFILTIKWFVRLQKNVLQSFKLPRPVLCIGGVVKVEFLGRIQKQVYDDLYYIWWVLMAFRISWWNTHSFLRRCSAVALIFNFNWSLLPFPAVQPMSKCWELRCHENWGQLPARMV